MVEGGTHHPVPLRLLHRGQLLRSTPSPLPHLTSSLGRPLARAGLSGPGERGGPQLTLHVHADGLDGRHPHAVLSLAVVAAALRACNTLDAQRLVEHRCLLELVRGATCRLGPPYLGRQAGQSQTVRLTRGGGLSAECPATAPPFSHTFSQAHVGHTQA